MAVVQLSHVENEIKSEIATNYDCRTTDEYKREFKFFSFV
jgi:hypothetical protein